MSMWADLGVRSLWACLPAQPEGDTGGAQSLDLPLERRVALCSKEYGLPQREVWPWPQSWG